MNEIEVRQLFAKCVAALNYRALRFEVRERPFALLLAVESFGRGQEWGLLDVRGWRSILCENDDKSIWRLAELHRLLKVFVQNGWLVVDAAAGTYRLRPDQWPCWAHVCALIGGRDRARLDFVPEADLNSLVAILSQQNALTTHENFSHLRPAKNSQTAKFSQDRFAPPHPVPPPKPPEKPGLSAVSFESVSGRVSENFSQSSSCLDPSVSTHNRSPEQIQKSIGSGSNRDSALEQGPIRAERAGGAMLRAPVATLCVLDGYIAEKLKNHPKGERLRRELAGQATFTAQAFQRLFERHPDQAREDLGWFLEANNPNARMNTHLQTVIQK
jgi:hypothetical protein